MRTAQIEKEPLQIFSERKFRRFALSAESADIACFSSELNYLLGALLSKTLSRGGSRW